MWENTGGYYGVYCEIRKTLDFDGSTIKVEVYERHDSNGLTGYFFGKVLIDSTEILSFDLGTNENQWISRSGSTTPSSGSHTLKLRFYTDPSSGNLIQLWWDDVRVRKYVSPEPAHGSWGTEEKNIFIGNFEAPSIVYADAYFLLNATIIADASVSEFINATIELENGVVLMWDAATDTFNKYQDTNGYCTLDAAGSFKTQLNSTSYKLSWRISLSSSFPPGYVDIVNADVYTSAKHGTNSDTEVFYLIAYTGWWNNNWTKRKPILVTENTGSDFTDFQLAMNLTYDADMQADFDDLRFTWLNETSNSEVLCDAWLERKTESSWAYVWVEVPELPASGTTILFIYYGNSSVSSYWNGTATFILFENFDDGDASDWTYYETDSSFQGYITGTRYYSSPYSYELYRYSGSAGSNVYCEIRKDITFDGSTVILEFKENHRTDYSSSGAQYLQVYLDSTKLLQVDIWFNENFWHARSVTTTPTLGTHTLKLRLYDNSGTSQLFRIDWDDLHIRKYASIDPSFSIGSEESAIVNNAPSISEFQAPSTVYADYYFWLNVTVADADGVADIDYVTVQIETIVLKWDSSGDVFSEQSDPSDLCTLDAAASTNTQLSSTSYKLSFRLKLSWSFTEGSVDVSATAYDVSAASGSLSQAELFTFEDDVVVQGCYFSTGSEITVKGNFYYEGTSIAPTSGVTVKAEYGGSVKASTSSLTNGLFTLSWTESTSDLRSYTIYAVTDEPSTQNQTLQAFSFFVDGQFRWGFSNDTISSFSWDDTQDRLNVTFSSPANSTLYVYGRPTYILGEDFDLSTAYSGGWTRLDLNQTTSVVSAHPNWGDFYVRKLTAGEVTDAYWTDQVFTLELNGTSGTTATLEIYCGSRGMPKSISGFTGEVEYDADTTILSGTVAYQSPVTITLDYTIPTSSGSTGGGGPSSSSAGISILPAVSLNIAPVEFVQLHPGETVTGILTVNFTGVNNIRVLSLEFSGAAADWITLAEPLPKTLFKPIGEEVGTGEIELRIIAPENAEPGDYTVPVVVKAEAVGSQIQTNGYMTFSIIPQTPPVSLVPEYMTWVFAGALIAMVLYSYLKD